MTDIDATNTDGHDLATGESYTIAAGALVSSTEEEAISNNDPASDITLTNFGELFSGTLSGSVLRCPRDEHAYSK
jgi:hypothetical protein